MCPAISEQWKVADVASLHFQKNRGQYVMAVFCYTAELDLSSLHMHLYG